MTFIEWAQVVLPLLALGWGLCLVAVYPHTIESWVAGFDEWWSVNFQKMRARPDEPTRRNR